MTPYWKCLIHLESFCLFCWFGIGSLNVALAGLELTESCLTLPCECWEHTCVPAHWTQEMMLSLELKQYFEHFVTIGLFSSQLVPLMLRFPKAGFLCHRWAQCPLKEFFRALGFKRVLILLPTPADPISQFFLNEAINILVARPTLNTLLLNRHRSWTHTWFGSIQTGIFLRPHLSNCLQPESLEATIRRKKNDLILWESTRGGVALTTCLLSSCPHRLGDLSSGPVSVECHLDYSSHTGRRSH